MNLAEVRTCSEVVYPSVFLDGGSVRQPQDVELRDRDFLANSCDDGVNVEKYCRRVARKMKLDVDRAVRIYRNSNTSCFFPTLYEKAKGSFMHDLHRSNCSFFGNVVDVVKSIRGVPGPREEF